MPVRKVKGGYKWGRRGKVYKNRKKAAAQGYAAFKHGYREPGQRRNINMNAIGKKLYGG
jgi:hypothetical protein